MNTESGPAVVIHSLADARQALAAVRRLDGRSAVLLSAPAAGCFMGAAWWRALIGMAASEHPLIVITDLLDCDAAAGRALEALRAGQRHLILSLSCPQRAAVLERAMSLGASLRAERPAALDLGGRDAGRQLDSWLTPSDSPPVAMTSASWSAMSAHPSIDPPT